jgi:YgiT-type zinc finger domain-containing protein
VELVTPTDYGRCPCGEGVYDRRTVEVTRTGDDEVILTDVPRGVCPSCGSLVYKAAMLEGIEAVLRRRPPPPPRARP